MWFQGAMEYGPRALGQRSVLARPDRLDIRDRLNLALKRRVWYQPFCPSLLENDARRMLADWDGGPNRSMTMAYEVAGEYRCQLAGVMSVDGTCRPQIVAGERYRRLRAAAAGGAAAVGCRCGAQYQLQHSRRTAGLRSGRGRRRLSPVRSGRSGDRSLPGHSSRMIDLATDRSPSQRAWVARGTRVGALRRGAGRMAARNVHGHAAGTPEGQPVLVARAVPVPRGDLRRLGREGRTARSRQDRYRRDGSRGAGGGRPHALRRAAHEPHLLRRADLSEHRPEPGRPEAGADLQRRRRGVRSAEVRERRIQQAAVRVPAPVERGLSAHRRSRRDRIRRQRSRDGGHRVRGLCSRLAALPGSDGGAVAALVLALTPHQIIWSATAAVEPSASLAAVLALVCAAYYANTGGAAALAAFAVCAAYAIQFRPESILVLPVAALIAWPRLRIEAREPRGWWAALLFLVLASVHIAHLFAVRHIDWGTNQARFSLAYVPSNLRVNGLFYLVRRAIPGRLHPARAVRPLTVRIPQRAAGDDAVFPALLRYRPAVLCRQL